MKRLLSIVATLVAAVLVASAKPVDPNTAYNTAKAHIAISGSTTAANRNSTALTPAFDPALHRVAIKNSSPAARTPFYVFNVDGGGFVIVAADDRFTPILGYSHTGSFDPENIPTNTRGWLNIYTSEMEQAIASGYEGSQTATGQWHALSTARTIDSETEKPAIEPLIKTKWDQTEGYNELCPYDNDRGTRTVTGCVATAMAQVMRYWKHPLRGTGHHSYVYGKFDTISASFGSTVYDWNNMPEMVTDYSSPEEVNAVSTLVFHCGVGVNMMYKTYSEGGSGSFTMFAGRPHIPTAETALRNYFGYSKSLKGVQKSNYNDSDWADMLYNEIKENRPVIYSGNDGQSGHCFVLDGYDGNGLFHFNWGWTGRYDGYFSLSALNPGTGGTGSGSGVYTEDHEVIIGIEPAVSTPAKRPEANIVMFSDIKPSALYYNWQSDSPLTVEAQVANFDTDTFSGQFYTEFKDVYGNVAAYSDTTSVIKLAPDNNASIRLAPKAGLMPGMYYANLHCIENNNTVLVPDSLGANNAEITVELASQSGLSLESEILINNSLATSLKQGKKAMAQYAVVNYGDISFKGNISLALFNINDGSFVEELFTYNEQQGLDPGYYMRPGAYITPEAEPGTYVMALLACRSDETEFQYVGTSYYKNPVIVEITGSPKPSGTQTVTDNSITIAPNPATDFAEIKSDSPITGLTLFDLQGKIVLQQTIATARHSVTIPLTNIDGGVYIIKVRTTDSISTQKIIVRP